MIDYALIVPREKEDVTSAYLLCSGLVRVTTCGADSVGSLYSLVSANAGYVWVFSSNPVSGAVL